MKESGNNNFYFEFTTRSATGERLRQPLRVFVGGGGGGGVAKSLISLFYTVKNLSVTAAIKPPTEAATEEK